MFVTGAPWCDIAVLLGGLVFRIERVEASVEMQTDLYRKAVEFRNLLATDTAPPLWGEDSDALASVTPWNGLEEWAQADAGLDRVAQIYAEKQYESKLLDQELQNLAISLKEAIGEKAGITGEGWSATWKQNKSSQKVDYKLLLEALKPSVEVVDAYTREVPGARVFKFKTEEVDK